MSAAHLTVAKIPHACARAKERYGLDLDRHDLKQICWRIQNNEGSFVSKTHEGVSAWDIEINGVMARILMSRDLYCVMTFLPPDGKVVRFAPPRTSDSGRRKVYFGGKPKYMRTEP